MIFATLVRCVLDSKQSLNFKRYSLIRDKVSVNDTPFPSDKINEIDDEVLRDIIKTIENSFNSKDLDSFHINLKNLKIRTIESIRNSFNLAGSYNTLEDTIYLRNDPYYRQALSHEMLHLASTRKRGKRPNPGFAQGSLFRPSIGYGLTEGYTEYLSTTKFNNEPDRVYLVEKVLAKSIEDLVGKDKMESLFLNSDLKGLYKELSNYYTEREIDTLLISIDNINRYAYRENPNTCITNIKNRSYQKVIHLINKGLLNKYKDSNEDRDLCNYISDMTSIKDVLNYLDGDGNKEFIDFIGETINIVIDYYNSDNKELKKTL